MHTAMESSEVVTVTTRRRGKETPTRITTTLYELVAALQDVVDPDADALVVATVVHLLRSGRLTFLGKTRTYPCQSRHEMQAR